MHMPTLPKIALSVALSLASLSAQAQAPGQDLARLQALVDWVENGKTPERITAKGSAVYPQRSRPLCAYPSYAHYNGNGDPENASNFSCQPP
jgi:hypothetical protein